MIPRASTKIGSPALPTGVPEGFAAVPIIPAQAEGPLRICVLCSRQADPAAGHVVALPSSFESRNLIGCLTDSAGCVQQWLEICTQNVIGLADAPAAIRDALSNRVLDERWRDTCRALNPGQNIHTGWEDEPGPIVWLDPARGEPIYPVDSTGEKWQLCRDDQALVDAGLPVYSSSLHRYLSLASQKGKSKFVAVTSGAPSNANTAPLESLFGGRSDLVVINPGGLMLIRPHNPVSLASVIEILGGKRGEVVLHGRSAVALKLPLEATDDSERSIEDAWLFMGAHGRWGRLMEAFHLKLRLIADAVTVVHLVLRQLQRPLLNIADDHFSVRVAEPGCGLPILWTSRLSLTDSGDAIELPIKSSDLRYYMPGPRSAAGIYRPPGTFGRQVQGRCSLRIREVLPDAGGLTIAQGTFFTQERMTVARSDLAWIRLALGSGSIDLYAHLETEPALAAGELRFRTVGQRLAPETVKQLRSLEGVSLPEASFELIPLISSPCDLYALGVLAVRVLLVNAGLTHAAALDAMTTLARQVGQQEDDTASLRLRVRSILEGNKRLLTELGPDRLAWEPVDPAQALDLIPMELWCDALAMIVRMFPGYGPDSICRDWGDVNPLAKHLVFEATIKDLDMLLLRTRSLIMIDWRFNREIHAVIRSQTVGLPSKSATMPKPQMSDAPFLM
jgi:hypothetical protein